MKGKRRRGEKSSSKEEKREEDSVSAHPDLAPMQPLCPLLLLSLSTEPQARARCESRAASVGGRGVATAIRRPDPFHNQFSSPHRRRGQKLRSENELTNKQKDKDIQSLGEAEKRLRV